MEQGGEDHQRCESFKKSKKRRGKRLDGVGEGPGGGREGRHSCCCLSGKERGRSTEGDKRSLKGKGVAQRFFENKR